MPPVAVPRSFITVFVTLFAIVIAITKDLPDVEGDKVRTLRPPRQRYTWALRVHAATACSEPAMTPR
jgi:hypothetical protein